MIIVNVLGGKGGLKKKKKQEKTYGSPIIESTNVIHQIVAQGVAEWPDSRSLNQKERAISSWEDGSILSPQMRH